jgi:hypothetical protein
MGGRTLVWSRHDVAMVERCGGSPSGVTALVDTRPWTDTHEQRNRAGRESRTSERPATVTGGG